MPDSDRNGSEHEVSPLSPRSKNPIGFHRARLQACRWQRTGLTNSVFNESTGPKLIGSQGLVQSTQPCPHTHIHTCPSGTHVSERSLLCRSTGHNHTVRSPSEATHTDHIPSAHQDVLHNHESSPRRFYIPVGSNLLRTARLSEPARARQCPRTLSRGTEN